MDILKKIFGKNRRPSDRAQLVALQDAVVIYTDDGAIVVTPRLAKDIRENLDQIIESAESKPTSKDEPTDQKS
ncbi:MAG: hypothetical protein IPL32_17990 [Chloracidobacterium sp.]|nr:hypothetical protein [Chloracidobacterium sp.]